MHITLELPEDLAMDSETISRAALEGVVQEGLRTGKMSTARARRLLGISSRFEMDAFLKSRSYELPTTLEEVKRDAENALAFSRSSQSDQRP